MRLAVLGRLLRGYWRLLVLLVIVGGLAGGGTWLLLSPGYQATSTVLLPGPREEDELRTEARLAVSTPVLERAAAALGGGITTDELRETVRAEVTEGNVVELSGNASTPDGARRIAEAVAEEYAAFSTKLGSETADGSADLLREQQESLRQQVMRANRRITELHDSVGGAVTVESVQARTNLEALRSALNAAIEQLAESAAGTGRANAVVLGPAGPADAAAPTLPLLVAGPAAGFALIGVFGLLVATRADRRLAGKPEIGAALGTTVLAELQVPDLPEQRRGWLAVVRRLLFGAHPWDLPASASEVDREIHYGRAVSRLPRVANTAGNGSGGLLLVVAEDDAPARLAAEELAKRAGPVAVTMVVRVSPARPVVPDGDSGVLVVLTSGSRTGWELVDLAAAAEDAGHPLRGAVLVHRTRPAPAQRARDPEDTAVLEPVGAP